MLPLSPERIFMSQLEVYKELMYDESLMNLNTPDDAYLQEFYDTETNTNIGAMARVRFYIGEEDETQAEENNSTITPENQAALNERITNEIYLDTWAEDIYTFTQAQYESLSDIAEQNPISGGPAVYTARVMLGVDYNDYGSTENRLSASTFEAASFMHIYPNPAGDEINVEYSLGENNFGVLTFTDITGREIMSQKIYSDQNLLAVSTKKFEDGIYFLRLNVNSELIGVEKLLIMR